MAPRPHAPNLLLSTRERWLIAAAIAAMVLPARAAIPIVAWLCGVKVTVEFALFGMTYLSIAIAVVPFLADALQRTVAWSLAARLTAQALLIALASVLVPLTVFLVYYAWNEGAEFIPGVWLRSIEPNVQTALLLYATAAGIVRAIQWYRSSKEVERERVAIEAAEVMRTRSLVHETLRPGTVADVLARVGVLLRTDPAQGERLVRRLARHCRRSLERVRGGGTVTAGTQLRGIASAFTLRGILVSVEAEAAASLPASDALARFGKAVEEAVRHAAPSSAVLQARCEDEVLVIRLCVEGPGAAGVLECARAAGASIAGGEAELRILPSAEAPAAPPHAAVRLFGSLYLWLVGFVTFGGLSTIVSNWLAEDFYGGGVPIMMAFLWPLAAPPLIWIADRAVALPRTLAIPLIVFAVWGAGFGVTAIAVEILYRMDGPVADGMHLSRAALIGQVLPYPLTRNVLVACAVASVQFAFSAGRRHLKAEEEKERVRRDVASQEFRELEATIHPHFLFNALTSLLALIRIDVARAAAMCSRLAALFTRTIASAGVQEWELSRELEVVSDYLAVQQIRFGDRLSVSYAIDPAARAAIVPRLLLQPLVENAVRHGAAHRAGRTEVSIEAAVERGELRLRVRNDGPPGSATMSFGAGLRFVTARSRACGGSASIVSDRAGFTVTCLLPLRDRLTSH